MAERKKVAARVHGKEFDAVGRIPYQAWRISGLRMNGGTSDKTLRLRLRPLSPYSTPAKMNIAINVLLAIDMLVAVLMTFVILMQRPKSEGLGAAFGGGVTENIFGAQTTNVLTKFTGWLAGFFFILTFVLGILYAQRSGNDSSLHRQLMALPASTAPAASPAPAAGSPGTSPTASTGPSVAPNVSPSSTPKPSDLAIGMVPQQSAAPSPSATPSASPPL
jgi:preprotein translocase subunit SecG